jgi:hypothetical protein
VSADSTAGEARSPVEPPLAPDAPTPTEPDEKRFGRFQLLGDEPLGKGSFGEVWRAYDPELHREVALKFPRPGKLLTTVENGGADRLNVVAQGC